MAQGSANAIPILMPLQPGGGKGYMSGGGPAPPTGGTPKPWAGRLRDRDDIALILSMAQDEARRLRYVIAGAIVVGCVISALLSLALVGAFGGGSASTTIATEGFIPEEWRGTVGVIAVVAFVFNAVAFAWLQISHADNSGLAAEIQTALRQARKQLQTATDRRERGN